MSPALLGRRWAARLPQGVLAHKFDGCTDAPPQPASGDRPLARPFLRAIDVRGFDVQAFKPVLDPTAGARPVPLAGVATRLPTPHGTRRRGHCLVFSGAPVVCPGAVRARSCADWGTHASLPLFSAWLGLARRDLLAVGARAAVRKPRPQIAAAGAHPRKGGAATACDWAVLRRQSAWADNDLYIDHAFLTELCGGALSARAIARALAPSLGPRG
jgi:hypothetical protein